MSYWCKIGFKQIDGNDIYGFLQEFKAEIVRHIPEIAEHNASFSPLFKNHPLTENFEPSCELEKATCDWAQLSLFRYRWFYNKDLHLLGVYSIDEPLYGLFDCVHEFQNSCDQDYAFDTWDGVEYFEEVTRKWRDASFEDIKASHENYYRFAWDGPDSLSGEALDYYRRSAAYWEIWGKFEHTLDSDSDAVYFSPFGFYDFEAIRQFYICVEDAVNKKIKTWIEEFNQRGNKDGKENS